MPTLDNVEEYLRSVEEYFYSSLLAVTYSLPDVHEVVNQLWLDISRYGPGLPSLPDVHIPSIGSIQIPPPPPPPPPPSPSSWLSSSADLIDRHPWKTTGIVAGVVGAGLLVGYGRMLFRRRRHIKAQKMHTGERRQVVVVLGGDTPYALLAILELEKKGYIVIASVSSSEAIDILESQCRGYVKAHVLDPFEPATISPFLRSLTATLSRKFPIGSPGDPFASPSSIPYIHSVISFLSLSADIPNIYAPFEHISLSETYLPYLTGTQITPLQVIQALLPLLRTGSARSKDVGKKSIVVCLPATDTRVGLPFASLQAMSAAGTLRGIEVLRREINVAALTDKTDSMKNIKVCVVDVGTFSLDPAAKNVLSDGIYKSMEDWTASEKLVYGPAFVAVIHKKSPATCGWARIRSVFKHGYRYGVPRKPTDLSVLARSLVEVVSGDHVGPKCFFSDFGWSHVRYWTRGERFSVGAGACTYRVASHLPSLILDGLLRLPHFLISIRNRLLPVQPFDNAPPELPAPVTTKEKATPFWPQPREEHHDTSSSSEVESLSEADVESNAEEMVESTWVSLEEKRTDV